MAPDLEKALTQFLEKQQKQDSGGSIFPWGVAGIVVVVLIVAAIIVAGRVAKEHPATAVPLGAAGLAGAAIKEADHLSRLDPATFYGVLGLFAAAGVFAVLFGWRQTMPGAHGPVDAAAAGEPNRPAAAKVVESPMNILFSIAILLWALMMVCYRAPAKPEIKPVGQPAGTKVTATMLPAITAFSPYSQAVSNQGPAIASLASSAMAQGARSGDVLILLGSADCQAIHAPGDSNEMLAKRRANAVRNLLLPRNLLDPELKNRPLLEMADIVRCAGQAFVERSRRWINWQHQKVLLAIARCRTAALGGHRDRCTGCGHTTKISYNLCRNRHCPRCQGNARRRWLQARERELLPTRYVHAVFTLPRELAPLALQNKRLIYNLLFHSSAETLLEVARDPRHLGAEIGFFSVLHSWNQRLQFHPHVHCVLAAGGLAPDHSRWISAQRSFFLPIGVLSRVFRGKFVAGLRNAFHRGEIQFYGNLAPLAQPRAFAAWLRVLFRHDWVVYSKPPFGGPQHVLRYLGAYTHRVTARPVRC